MHTKIGRSLRWRAFLVCSRLGFKRAATWLLIDRRPLTPTQIQHGQELWEQLKREGRE